MDKTLAYAVAIAGIVTGIVAAVAPILVASIRHLSKTREAPDVEPLMGIPVPIDHTHDAYDMLKSQLAERNAEKALLQQQLTEAYVGWRMTQTQIDRANARLRELDESPF